MGQPAINLRGINKSFGDKQVLHDLDLRVEQGEVYGLLGRNGAGKTTTIRIATTILVPDSGTAEVLGVDVVAQPAHARRLIGMAGQLAAVDDTLTGRENLRLIGRLTHLPARQLPGRVDALLERIGLAEVADQPAKTYSGGTRRRLDLAAALVHEPQVLFLDEPTTGLDPQSRLALWDDIRALAASGSAVFLTTQYLEEADRLAHRVGVLKDGVLITEGSPGSLKSAMGSSVIEVEFADADSAVAGQRLLADNNLDSQREAARLWLTGSGARLMVEVGGVLERAGIEPAGIALRQPSLDDVFLSLTDSTGPSNSVPVRSTGGVQ